MNITTRKRRARKGVKWINHFYSKWYHLRLALGQMMAASVIAQGAAQIGVIKSSPISNKKEKIAAIAEIVIETQKAAIKASRHFI